MNDYSILMHLLTRQRGAAGEIVGSSIEELLKALDFTDKNSLFRLYQKMNEFSEYVRPLGLKMQYNPINSHWYIIQDKVTVEIFKENPLFATPRLAATLMTIILLTSLDKKTTVSQISKYRNVLKIKQDLKALKDMGYINYNEHEITITEKIIYNLDINKLIEKIEYDEMIRSYVESKENESVDACLTEKEKSHESDEEDPLETVEVIDDLDDDL